MDGENIYHWGATSKTMESFCSRKNRPKKRSREKIGEIDVEIMRRANRLGGGYQPIVEEEGEPDVIREEGELEQEVAETEEDRVIMRSTACR